MNLQWTKDSWKNYKAQQQPEYPDIEKYEEILKRITEYPPLVFIGEVENLKQQLVHAGSGNRFILQGGDCAERFIDSNEQAIINKIKIILQMSVILTYGSRMPVVKVGRIAGQYSKPRSNDLEEIDGQSIHVYRGDSINQYLPGIEERMPDPERLLLAYYHSVINLNYIRSIIAGGFADLHHPYTWNLYSIEKTKSWERYKNTVEHILDAISFMESFGGLKQESLGRVDFFISHEGLLLGYEESLTRKDSDTGKYYNLGAHMLWIGERTRALDGAHVEYFRGISNPVGIKTGPSIDPEELAELVHLLNPKNEEGKVTIITRLGADNVIDILPSFLKTIEKNRLKVNWSCDPMHGNGIVLNDSRKTRKFEDILREVEYTFSVHNEKKTVLSGVHFELTGDDVSECIGGATGIKDIDLGENYETYCDPRLNYTQSLEMAFLISELLNKK